MDPLASQQSQSIGKQLADHYQCPYTLKCLLYKPSSTLLSTNVLVLGQHEEILPHDVVLRIHLGKHFARELVFRYLPKEQQALVDTFLLLLDNARYVTRVSVSSSTLPDLRTIQEHVALEFRGSRLVLSQVLAGKVVVLDQCRLDPETPQDIKLDGKLVLRGMRIPKHALACLARVHRLELQVCVWDDWSDLEAVTCNHLHVWTCSPESFGRLMTCPNLHIRESFHINLTLVLGRQSVDDFLDGIERAFGRPTLPGMAQMTSFHLVLDGIEWFSHQHLRQLFACLAGMTRLQFLRLQTDELWTTTEFVQLVGSLQSLTRLRVLLLEADCVLGHRLDLDWSDSTRFANKIRQWVLDSPSLVHVAGLDSYILPEELVELEELLLDKKFAKRLGSLRKSKDGVPALKVLLSGRALARQACFYVSLRHGLWS